MDDLMPATRAKEFRSDGLAQAAVKWGDGYVLFDVDELAPPPPPGVEPESPTYGEFAPPLF